MPIRDHLHLPIGQCMIPLHQICKTKIRKHSIHWARSARRRLLSVASDLQDKDLLASVGISRRLSLLADGADFFVPPSAVQYKAQSQESKMTEYGKCPKIGTKQGGSYMLLGGEKKQGRKFCFGSETPASRAPGSLHCPAGRILDGG